MYDTRLPPNIPFSAYSCLISSFLQHQRWWAGSVSSIWKTRFYDPPHTQSINATDQWPLGSHATYLVTRAPSGVAADVTVTVLTLLPWRTIICSPVILIHEYLMFLFDLQEVTVAVTGHVTVGRSQPKSLSHFDRICAFRPITLHYTAFLIKERFVFSWYQVPSV